MEDRVTVVGVYPVDPPGAIEPVHLVEVLVEGNVGEFYFIETTQEQPGRSPDDWQVAWSEYVWVESAERWESVWSTREKWESATRARFAFYFHGLNLDQPLLTTFGPAQLAAESPIPSHLSGVEYEVP